jgi:lipoprotein-releasing system permease protein
VFKPIAACIGLRYTRAKRRNSFISFISLASMLGIALGVAVLITVLSVMNGFNYEIKSRLFSMANQVTVSRFDGYLYDWQTLSKEVNKSPNVVASAPLVRAQGMLSQSGITAPVMITGVLPREEMAVSDLASNLQQGSFESLTPKSYHIIIGEGLAAALGVGVGDKVVLLTPQASASPLGVMPRFKQFTISGIFFVDGNAVLNQGAAFINLHDAQLLYQMDDAVSALRLRVSDLYVAPAVAEALQNTLPVDYMISDWTQEYGDYFQAIKMEKTMIFLILVLIVAVATFNLVSTLVMVVNDKQADIAILRTFGATPRMIMNIFIVQGAIVGFVGTFLGLIGGILLALNASAVVNFLQTILHRKFISSSMYFIDYLPSRLLWTDVWQICSIALVLSLLATLYPAWQASRTQPAEALRYE